MNNRKTTMGLSRLFALIISLAFFIVNVFAVDSDDEKKEAILNSIRIAADYATNVLLDENGKSRCDYHMVESKWYDYEPPWHTGQIIYALTEAYDITK